MLHARETTHFLCYVLISPDSMVYLLVNLFSKLYVTFIQFSELLSYLVRMKRRNQ